MAVTVTPTQTDILTALRSFLIAVLPTGIEVVRGQINRVPQPLDADFVVMTPLSRERIETNIDSYADGFPDAPGVRTTLQPTRVTVQLDIHGPDSADNAQIITTLFRDEYGCDAFRLSGFDITPLHTSDPRQLAFINAEAQYEDRWSLDVVMQANPVVTSAQQFAGTLAIGLIEIDTTYPPDVVDVALLVGADYAPLLGADGCLLTA